MRSSIFRAIAAIVIGALLVKFRNDAVVAITVTLGILFFISGIVACVSAFVAQRQAALEEGKGLADGLTWVVGMGSVIFGIVLVVMPKAFLVTLIYILAGILILSSLGQYASLAAATRYGRVGLRWWIMPTMLLLIGILCVVNPSQMISAPLLIIGWAMMVYGVVELTNALMIRRLFKQYAASLLVVEEPVQSEEPQEAEVVADEAEEVIDEPERVAEEAEEVTAEVAPEE